MTLPASGLITLGMVNTELGLAANAAISLNQANVRTLAGKPSGAISLNDLRGKSNYKVGWVNSYGFVDYGTSGMFYFSVTGAQPYAEIGIKFYANTSGQPLGGYIYLGTADASGNFYYQPSVANTDPYWYPVHQTNWFEVFQGGYGVYNLGAYAVSS